MISKVKKWGNSVGIIIPKETVKELHIKPGDEISLDIEKKTNILKELFGSAKGIKKSTKQIIEETRKEMGVD